MLMDTIKQVTGAGGIVQEDGVTPVTTGVIYDVTGYTLSKPIDAAVLMRISVGRSFKFPIGLVNSKAECSVVSTAAASYEIHQNGGSVGSIDFALGANDGTFTFVSEITFAVGDIITVVSPSTADATHDEISWLLAGELL